MCYGRLLTNKNMLTLKAVNLFIMKKKEAACSESHLIADDNTSIILFIMKTPSKIGLRSTKTTMLVHHHHLNL